MGLNNIELNSLHLTQLYQKVLVETVKNKVKPESQGIKYLGKNEGNILVLVREEEYPFLSDRQLQFLTSILTACKLSLADVAIVNTLDLDIEEIIAAIDGLKAKNVIAFGVEPSALGAPSYFPPFKVQQFDSRYFIHSPELAALENDQEIKKQLWTGLKTMFKL